MSEPFYAF